MASDRGAGLPGRPAQMHFANSSDTRPPFPPGMPPGGALQGPRPVVLPGPHSFDGAARPPGFDRPFSSWPPIGAFPSAPPDRMPGPPAGPPPAPALTARATGAQLSSAPQLAPGALQTAESGENSLFARALSAALPQWAGNAQAHPQSQAGAMPQAMSMPRATPLARTPAPAPAPATGPASRELSATTPPPTPASGFGVLTPPPTPASGFGAPASQGLATTTAALDAPPGAGQTRSATAPPDVDWITEVEIARNEAAVMAARAAKHKARLQASMVAKQSAEASVRAMGEHKRVLESRIAQLEQMVRTLQAEHARVTQERASLWGESEALADALNKSSQQLVVVSQRLDKLTLDHLGLRRVHEQVLAEHAAMYDALVALNAVPPSVGPRRPSAELGSAELNERPSMDSVAAGSVDHDRRSERYSADRGRPLGGDGAGGDGGAAALTAALARHKAWRPSSDSTRTQGDEPAGGGAGRRGGPVWPPLDERTEQ